MRKADIINAIASKHGYRRYLEICTSTTGGYFGAVDAALFDRCDRLLYFCPEGFSDGGTITYRTTRGRSDDAVAMIAGQGGVDGVYDLIFVDSHHTYHNSLCDLWAALHLLSPGGAIVVHDCNPGSAELITPRYQESSWCGRSFEAFIDFALAASNAGTCVVDADEGCGILFGRDAMVPSGLPIGRMSNRRAYEWAIAKSSEPTLYPFFDRHRRDLLNLVPAERFASLYDLPNPRAARPSLISRVRRRLSRALAP